MGHKNKTDLIEMSGISTNILAKLTKGEFISMDSIQHICKALNCDVGDICVINKVNILLNMNKAEKQKLSMANSYL